MLNFNDTEAVKAFTLKILVENRELAESLEFERKSSTDWFNNYKDQEKRADAAEMQIKDAIAKLENFSEARQEGVETGWNDVDRLVSEVLTILKGGSKNE